METDLPKNSDGNENKTLSTLSDYLDFINYIKKKIFWL